MLCQLEIPVETVAAAPAGAGGSASTRRPARARAEMRASAPTSSSSTATSSTRWPRRRGWLALTLGAEGAVLLEDGARGRPRPAAARRRRRRHGRRRRLHRLPRRLAARGPRPRGGAPPRLRRRRARRLAPGRAAVAADRRRGRRDAPRDEHARSSSTATRATTTRSRSCSRSRSPEVELRGVTTVAGNQTLEKTTANALRVLELAGRGEIPVAAGADRPLVREPRVAADVHGETGLDGPDLPPPQAAPSPQHAVDFLAERSRGATLVATGPLTNVALLLARHPEAPAGADRADGRRDRRGQRHAGGRVQHLGRPGGGARASSRAGST